MGRATTHAGTKIRWTPIKADRPNEVWETDITYVWCGQVDGWCFCFNVLDIFTRQWLSYRFSTLATADIAIESLVEAVAVAKPNCSRLTLQCDNGSQYAGKKFRKATSLLGIRLVLRSKIQYFLRVSPALYCSKNIGSACISLRLNFICAHTPEQIGHIESFHGTLKREYVWPHDFSNYQEAETSYPRHSGTTTVPGCTRH